MVAPVRVERTEQGLEDLALRHRVRHKFLKEQKRSRKR